MIQKGYLTHLNLHHFEEVIEDRGDLYSQYLGLGPKSSAFDKPKQNLSWNIMEPTDHGRKKMYPHYSVVARLVPNVPVLLYIYIYLLYIYYIFTIYILYIFC